MAGQEQGGSGSTGAWFVTVLLLGEADGSVSGQEPPTEVAREDGDSLFLGLS